MYFLLVDLQQFLYNIWNLGMGMFVWIRLDFFFWCGFQVKGCFLGRCFWVVIFEEERVRWSLNGYVRFDSLVGVIIAGY